MAEGQRARLNPKFAMAIGTLCVSFSPVLVRLSQAPPLVTATLRLLCTVLILSPIVLLRHRAELSRVTRRDLGLCGLSGAFLALHFWSWFQSLTLTSVATSTALVNTDVIFTALGFALFLKGRIPRLGAAAIGLAFAGSVVIALGSAEGGAAGAGGTGLAGLAGSQMAGNLLAVLSASLIAVYLLIGRVQRAHLSNSVYTWLVYTGCLITLLCACALTRTPLLGWSARDWLASLGLAVLCTLLGHSMFNWCLGYLTPAYVAATKLAEPILGTLLAFVLFREAPAPMQILGAAVVLAGIFLYSLAEIKEAKNIH